MKLSLISYGFRMVLSLISYVIQTNFPTIFGRKLRNLKIFTTLFGRDYNFFFYRIATKLIYFNEFEINSNPNIHIQ